ncbi:MAG: hypothetical protein ACXWLM_09655 [Myxococcales bacterium]
MAAGCELCFPGSADAAWAARSSLERAAELVDESHFIVAILACPACGQRFLSVFTETVDWADGDDPQHWTMFPIAAGESEALIRRGASLDEAALATLAHGRKSLHFDCPKGGPKRAWFSGS